MVYSEWWHHGESCFVNTLKYTKHGCNTWSCPIRNHAISKHKRLQMMRAVWKSETINIICTNQSSHQLQTYVQNIVHTLVIRGNAATISSGWWEVVSSPFTLSLQSSLNSNIQNSLFELQDVDVKILQVYLIIYGKTIKEKEALFEYPFQSLINLSSPSPVIPSVHGPRNLLMWYDSLELVL